MNARLRFPRGWLLLAIGTLFSTVAYAGQGVWTSGGPYGGAVTDLAIDPSNPATLYAGTYNGVFKSTDSGGTWTAARTGLTNLTVIALAINPSNPAMLYAGTSDGVFKSTDSGGAWASANTGLTNATVYALAINPTNPATLFAGTRDDGVFKSIDFGATWAANNTGLTSLGVSALAINPVTPSLLYAGTSDGVFKSTDSGGTWAKTGLTNGQFHALAIDPSTPSTLYAGADYGGIFKSNDAGATWAAANIEDPNLHVHALAINPLSPATLYAGTYRGVFKSTDSGGTWAAVNTGLPSPPSDLISALAINPTTPATLYAGESVAGVFKTTNSGTTWAASSTGLTNMDVYALAINRTNPATLYAGALTGVFKSADSGGTWAACTLINYMGQGQASGITFNTLAIDPSTPATLYGGTLGGGVFKSTDSGGTWLASNRGLTSTDVRSLAIDPSIPSTLYAGAIVAAFNTLGSGVFKSTDFGATWAAANAGLAYSSVFALVVDPSKPSTLYAGTGLYNYGFGSVAKSTDSGSTWANAGAGLPNRYYISTLAINPTTPATLYAGTAGGGVFKSTDSGSAWAPANAGLTNRNVTALAINNSTPTTLYAGTYGGGVFKSADSGGSWAAINAGLPSLDVNAIALDPSGVTTLYAGLANNSVWQSTPPPDGTVRIEEFVPIVLDVMGLAHYTSELQITNLGATSATVSLSYASSIGSGAGSVLETIPPGQQVVYPDAISYLRSQDIPIPASGNQGGTLLLSAPATGVRATVRTGADTVAPQPIGRAGLAYTGTDPAGSSSGLKIVYGLRTSDADRSNLAVYNMSADPISLKVTVVSGDDGRSFEVTAGAPRVLPAYGWFQYGDGLLLRAAGFSSGYAYVERVTGSGPFGAYGVVNDQITNDGSFIPALSETLRGSRLTIPVLVETGAFESELILINSGYYATTFTLRYVESLSPAKGPGGTTTVDVAGGRQKIIPHAIDFLRSKGVSIGARGEAGYAGSLQIQGTGFINDIRFAEARTSSLSPAGGEFGVFLPAIDPTQEFSDLAFVLGLKADAYNRSNVAAIHTGAEESGPITLEFQVQDGSEGGKAVGQPISITLNPGQWVQPARLFASGGVPNGYVRIRRTAGTAPWYAYGVINDGSQPGQRSGDGSYVPGVRQ